jgi:CheY-like chemotaxis protein
MKRVLVVDDNEPMRGFVEEALTRAGYEVLVAGDGGQAIEIFKQFPADLVLTDLFMPEKEGCETIVELRRLSPQLKIIAMSGGARNGADCLPIARALGAQRTLSKPITTAELLEAVQQVLGDTHTKAA